MAAFAATSIPAFADEVVSLPSGVSYTIVKSGDGPSPSIGELAGIRFKANVKQSGQQIDDIFETPEPYYTRVGSGGLIKVCIGENFARYRVSSFLTRMIFLFLRRGLKRSYQR